MSHAILASNKLFWSSSLSVCAWPAYRVFKFHLSTTQDKEWNTALAVISSLALACLFLHFCALASNRLKQKEYSPLRNDDLKQKRRPDSPDPNFMPFL